jgi:hypothetical protein
VLHVTERSVIFDGACCIAEMPRAVVP